MSPAASLGYTTRTTCRVCGSSALMPLFSLGDQYVSGFIAPGDEPPPRVPIELELCRECTLVQQKHTAPQELLYAKRYWYRSGVTQTMRDALADVVNAATALVPVHVGDVVLDIGSNDGTLLRSYPPGPTRVGIEPADNLVEVGSEGVDVFIHGFWGFNNYWSRIGQLARIVTALGMFYDLEEPNQFIGDVAWSLHPGGVFIAQLMCLKNMLRLNDVGNLCHEHLEFYSFKSLETLYNTNHLEIIDVETNDVNGQSYRVYARHIGGTVQPKPGAAERLKRVRESEAGLDNPQTLIDWFAGIEKNKAAVVEFIEAAVQDGKTVAVYGASTKGNVLLQYFGLDYPLIAFAADRSPEKWGRTTVGTNIPIVSEDEARERNPDYFLVLPYAFLGEFVDRESEWRSHGGRFIVPLPEMRIV